MLVTLTVIAGRRQELWRERRRTQLSANESSLMTGCLDCSTAEVHAYHLV